MLPPKQCIVSIKSLAPCAKLLWKKYIVHIQKFGSLCQTSMEKIYSAYPKVWHEIPNFSQKNI